MYVQVGCYIFCVEREMLCYLLWGKLDRTACVFHIICVLLKLLILYPVFCFKLSDDSVDCRAR